LSSGWPWQHQPASSRIAPTGGSETSLGQVKTMPTSRYVFLQITK